MTLGARTRLRAAGRPDRAAAAGADQAVGGGDRSPSRSPAGTGSPATWPTCPTTSTVHVLPTGADEPPRYADLSALRYRDFRRGRSGASTQAYAATADYLRAGARAEG